MRFDPDLPIIITKSPELDYAIDCGIAEYYEPDKEEIEIPILKISKQVESKQINRLKLLKQNRDNPFLRA